MAQTWDNSDNLHIKFGTDRAISTTAGEYKSFGDLRVIEAVVDLTTLTSTSSIIADTTVLPKNMFVEMVVLDVQTAAISAGSPTFDLGAIQSDRTTAISSGSGFITAEVYSGVLDTAGKKITYTLGTSKVGAAVGTTTGSTYAGALITARVNTSTFSAGKVVVRIYLRPAY